MPEQQYTVDLAALLQSFNSAILVLDQEQKIIAWNKRLAHFSGISTNQALCQKFDQLFPEMLNGRVHQAIIDNLTSGMPAAISNVLNRAPFPLFMDGSKHQKRIYQSITITRIQVNGEHPCCLVDITDVTPSWTREQQLATQIIEKKCAETALRAKSRQLQSALNAAHAGIFSYNTHSRIISWDDRSCAIIGCSSTYESDYDVWIQHIHPADRDNFDRHFMANLRDPKVFHIDLEYQQNNTLKECWIAVRAVITRDHEGAAVSVDGMLQDISIYWRQLYLLQEKTAAEFANKAKSVFLANMSHQLRTPLHGILSYAQLGTKKLEHAKTDKLDHYFQRIQGSGQLLLSLLDELLELAELEEGKITLTVAQHDLITTIDDCLSNLGIRIQEKNLAVDFLPTTDKFILAYDQLKISRVVTHLLENAIKFSNSLKPITISLDVTRETNQTYALLVVKDQGIGIPEDELEMVFENFQVSSRTEDGAGNRGIGLSFCRGVVASHHGRLWAENNDNGGVSLKMLLPVT